MERNPNRNVLLERGFVYEYELLVDGVVVDSWTVENLIPQVGVLQLSNAMFGDVSPIGTFYVGLFANNYLPSAGATSADLPSVIGEFVGYSEASRPIWQRVNDGSGTFSNAAARAAFTCTQSARLYGGFLVSTSLKGGNDGVLISVARFNSPKDVEAGMVLRVKGELAFLPVTTA